MSERVHVFRTSMTMKTSALKQYYSITKINAIGFRTTQSVIRIYSIRAFLG